MPERDIQKLPDQIADPLTFKFVTHVLIAEDERGRLRGFAIILFDPRLKFAFLELVSTPVSGSNSGVGAALYSQVRVRAKEANVEGIYFECLPDEIDLSRDPAIRKQNIARLRFYERFAAYPILGTLYESPVEPGTSDSPFLVFDGLGEHTLPQASRLQKIVRSILERKYSHLCTPEYIRKVEVSIVDGGYRLRPPRYVRRSAPPKHPSMAKRFPIIVNEGHNIHHIRERGYVEAPARVAAILRELEPSGLFERKSARRWGDSHIKAVHDPALVNYVERACAETAQGKSIYPYVFPIRNAQRMPKDRSVLSGYWCIDTFTPITSTAYLAARGAVDCALTAAAAVLNGAPAAYALVRPPGHHAEKKAFGGFCYFNNAAITAHFLSGYGRVAVLDIDYHHGNGTQDIFYTRSDVLTVSIHGDPSIAYPYFSGFRDETGRDEGAGYNLNLPLAETITPDTHRNALVKALKRISRHSPAYLVIALGLDIAKGDPTGTWTYRANDFARMGQMIAELGLPCVVVQEGGYAVRNLGSNARNFFSGIARGLQISENLSKKLSPKSQGEEKLRWRDAVQPGDAELVQALVTGADRFTPEQMAIAKAQVSERIEKGRISGYRFVVVEQASRLAGYACFGRITDSDHSYRLHQIVVTNEHKDTGLAQEILQRVEALVRDTGGRILLAEASSAAPYASLRDLYTESGFSELVVIQDFYRLGCSKLIFRKDL